MDNASIHKVPEIQALIVSRGYKATYLPPYSPFLNPIEEFWSKIKAGVKRDCLTSTDNLSARIAESAKRVSVEDCQGWVRHSISFFDWSQCFKTVRRTN
jgi:transposase